MRSCLYVGSVTHARVRPAVHRFRYAVTSFALDLDELAEVDRRLRLFALNRRAVTSFHDRDHLDGAGGSTKAKLERFLARRGVEAGGPVILVTQCRLLGYVFNPVSFHYCHDRAGALVAIVAEVNNTFGERHLYLLSERERVPPSSERRYRVRKAMHVSPFLASDATYEFRFAPLGEHLSVEIDEIEDGETRVATAVHGERRVLDDRALARFALLRPFQTWKITAAIHWEAFRLWRKKVPFSPQPPPTPEQVAQARELGAKDEWMLP